MGQLAEPNRRLIGRDRELEQIARFHVLSKSGSTALLIGGDPGTGRTTLLLAALSPRDVLVLRARPQPEESAQAFSALRDLLAPGYGAYADRLAPPLRRALDGALLIRDPDERSDPSLVGPAVAAALEAAASQGQVVVAIDDAQWLDADTLEALRYAVRRLPKRVSIAAVHRDGDEAAVLLGVDRTIPVERRISIEARPLTLAGVHHLLAALPGVSRKLVVRVAAASAGNPRAAIELANGWRDRAEGDPDVPASVAALVDQRLGGLSRDAERLVRLIAVSGRVALSDLRTLTGEPEPEALEEAERAGAIVEEGGAVRAADALVATVVIGRATPSAIRAAHRHLAAVAGTPDERARHLAALPDAGDHLDEIERGAEFALRRGAAAAAAALFDRAVDLTADADASDRARRLRGHAKALLAAGDAAAARDAAEAAIAMAVPADRPASIAELADIAWADGTMRAERGRARAALAEATDPRVRLHLTTALVAFGVADDPRRAVDDATAALRELPSNGDDGRRGYLLIHREMASALAGLGVDWDRLEEGMRLEAASLEEGRPPSSPPLVLFTMCDRADEARARHAIEDAWYAARGEDGWRAERAGQLALVELRAGNTARAQQLADDACDRLDRLQVGGGWPLVYTWRSLVDAHLGRLERARATVATLLESVPDGTLWAAIIHSVAIAVAHADHDHAGARLHANAMRAITDALGVGDLLADRSEPLLAEVRAATGDRAGAAEELARLERRHAALPRPWTAAALGRTRAVVFAADGQLEAASAALDDTPSDDHQPFEAAWNQLARGRLQRRRRDKRQAAETLGAARDAFERLGAHRWADQASAELARVGLRRTPAGELTEGELAIARLAARGLTSSEIANAAFVSLKTVEANLTRIYRKLGIGSRAELGALMQQREGSPET